MAYILKFIKIKSISATHLTLLFYILRKNRDYILFCYFETSTNLIAKHQYKNRIDYEKWDVL